MNHTKAPWKCKFKKHCDWSIRGADGYSILGIPHDIHYGRPEEDKANARLVTAAPELYAILKKIITDRGFNLMQNVKTADELIKIIEGKK